MKRVKPGDVIEVPTAMGVAFAQYTHRQPQMGYLIRVFEPLLDKTPDALEDFVQSPVRFSAFVPLQSMVNQSVFQVVGNARITEENKTFPVFRSGVGDKGGVRVWFLWDGEGSWRVGALRPGMEKLPLWEVLNDTALVYRIEKNWRPEKDAV